MSASMRTARERVNLRLARLEPAERDDHTTELGSIALLCSGTDVIGPELTQEIREGTAEALAILAATTCECEGSAPPAFNCSSPTVLAGVLIRTFWLGYELGRP